MGPVPRGVAVRGDRRRDTGITGDATMCKATLFRSGLAQGQPGAREVEIAGAEGKTPATALVGLIERSRTLPTPSLLGPSGVDVTNEDGLLAFTAYGSTAEEAIDGAIAMHNKARLAGGR